MTQPFIYIREQQAMELHHKLTELEAGMMVEASANAGKIQRENEVALEDLRNALVPLVSKARAIIDRIDGAQFG